jgi:hypothetical protein
MVGPDSQTKCLFPKTINLSGFKSKVLANFVGIGTGLGQKSENLPGLQVARNSKISPNKAYF